jgi:non-heme chloroperoxidase
MNAPLTFVSRDQERVLRKAEAEQGVTEIGKMAGRGHSPTIDAGWREVVEKALEFVKRFA